MLRDLRELITGRGLTWLAGIGLVLVGILCLGVSGAVAQGWWQGTLDAFGVGFVVGGVVDVIAIFSLNQAIAAEDQRQQSNNEVAREILRKAEDEDAESRQRHAYYAALLLASSRRFMDERLRTQLAKLVQAESPDMWSILRKMEKGLYRGDAPHVRGAL